MVVGEVDPSVCSVVVEGVVPVGGIRSLDGYGEGCRHHFVWYTHSAEPMRLTSRHVGDVYYYCAVGLEILKVFNGGVGNYVYVLSQRGVETGEHAH